MRLWGGFLAIGAVAIVLYGLLPDGSVAQAVTDIALQALVAPAILLGVRRHRPARPTGWYVLAGAQAFYTAGNVVSALAALERGGVREYPGPADYLYLLAYAGLAVGSLLLLTRRTYPRGAGVVIDTMTVTLGLSSLVWVLLVEPLVGAPGTTLGATVVTAAYTLFDVAVIAILLNLALTPGARTASFWFFVTAMLAQLAADSTYAVVSSSGDFPLGHPAFQVWMAFYAFLGACALHPSMRGLAEPGGPPSRLLARARMAALGVAALVPPATTLFHHTDRSHLGVAWITIVTFVTVLVRLFRTHRDLEQQEAMDRMRQQFVSIVSHELRTPLTVIKGVLDSLERGVGGELPPGVRPLLAMGRANGERLHRLVDDLLDVQRHAAGLTSSVIGTVAVATLFEQVREELEPRALAAGVALTAAPASAHVRGDEQRLHQILVNLVDNAIKFSRRGGSIHLSASVRSGEVLLRVRDDGRGIPAAMHERIFDPFQQVDASDARERNGTGLGLSICRSLVQQHGGRIWVESVPGQGSTFLLTLPLAGELEVVGSAPATASVPVGY